MLSVTLTRYYLQIMLNFKSRICLSLLFLLPALPCLSQQAAADSAKIYWSFHHADSSYTLYPYSDTLIDNIQCYDPAANNSAAFATQGNIGKAVKNLVPSFLTAPGFPAFYTVFDPYRYDPDNIRYYNNLYPFTDLHYVMGGKKEQLFEIIHSQAVGKRFTAGVNMRIINSPGSYTHQKSDNTNLSASLQYRDKPKRYQASLAFCQNILKMQENGGITKDSVFENNTEADRRVIPVNLQYAQNRIRETSALFWQEYKWLSDSAVIKHPALRYLPVFVAYSGKYTENSFVYEEPLPSNSFYPFPAKDSAGVQDELLLHYLKNKILLHNSDDGIFSYAFGFGHEYFSVRNGNLEGRFAQVLTSLKLKLRLPLGFAFGMHGNQVNGGYNGGDNALEVSLSNAFSLSKQSKAKIDIWKRTSVATPNWIQQQYRSNLFNWDNSFYPVKTYSYGIDLQYRKITAGYQLHELKSFIYNAPITSVPAQITAGPVVTQAYLQLRFKVWKIVVENRLDYQHVNNDFLHLPEYISRSSVYLNLNLIHGALLLQPGIDLYYQSAYYADAYMPATRTFYLQHDTKLSDQFYADVFIQMKVSRARLFLKYQHFNSRMGPFDYYMIPHYPQQDAALKFGIFWMLRDMPDRDKKFG